MGKEKIDLKEVSRKKVQVEGITLEGISAGALQRIADIVEAMALSVVQMQEESLQILKDIKEMLAKQTESK